MPGPLPQETRRRRNAPTIPTTSLPAEGHDGPVPRVPPFVKLGTAGKAYWRWAWKTPQAAAWALGHEAVVARRASIEDDLAALARVQGLNLADHMDDPELADAVESMVRRLAALSSGRLQLIKEARELDDRLGLTPKAMAQLRWTIAKPDAPAATGGTPSSGGTVVTPVPERWRARTG